MFDLVHWHLYLWPLYFFYLTSVWSGSFYTYWLSETFCSTFIYHFQVSIWKCLTSLRQATQKSICAQEFVSLMSSHFLFVLGVWKRHFVSTKVAIVKIFYFSSFFPPYYFFFLSATGKLSVRGADVKISMLNTFRALVPRKHNMHCKTLYVGTTFFHDTFFVCFDIGKW